MTTSATGVRPAHEVLAWSRQLVEPALREAVHTLPPATRLIAGYHFGWWEADGFPTSPDVEHGKAIRPAMALLAAEAVGAAPASALPAAAAAELVHNFSLIQDDVIDGDLTRRHRPTVSSVFGTGPAIVTGDALLALAFDVLRTGDDGGAAAQHSARILHAAVLELIEGQHADLAFENRAEVDLAECVTMAEQKSGALLGGACALGARSAGANPAQVEQLRGFGVQVGVAFQLADDMLGIWGEPAITGKPVHADLQRRKKSLPLVAALASGTRAAGELARLYQYDRPLSPAELVLAVDLVEQAGARAWSRRQAADLLAGARRALAAAVDPTSRAAGELAGLARLAAYRDH